MKALSVRQPWANLIADGSKTIEVRTRPTKYRGPLLIVSAKRPDIAPAGCALAVVNLADSRPMAEADEQAAMCRWRPNAWAWILADVRRIKPQPVRGQLGLFEAPIRLEDPDR